MNDLTALYDEHATEQEVVDAYQYLINTGQAWRMEGHVGRTAMRLIENGQCVLGEQGHRDYWGNYVPSRTEVEPGTKGSVEYACDMNGHDWQTEDIADGVVGGGLAHVWRTYCSRCDAEGDPEDLA